MELVKEDDVLKILAKLPPMAFVGPTEAATFGIATGYALKRGVAGYFPVHMTDATAEMMNAQRNVTRAQVEAMQAGSSFGWDVPAADPDNYSK